MKLSFSSLVKPFLIASIIFAPASGAQAKRLDHVETIDQHIEATVYSLKRSRDYTLIEIGFENTQDHYVSFTPQEIYLNDRDQYSVAPLPIEELTSLAERTPITDSVSMGSLIGAVVLGVAGIAAAGSNRNLAKGLGIAALALGGTFIISAVLENAAKQNRLVTFKNNTLKTINKLPPHMILGGFLYFPKVKHPTSLTIMVKKSGGGYERKIIPLKTVKAPRKAGHNKYAK